MIDRNAVWSFPKGGTVPDLTPFLAAEDAAALAEASTLGQAAAVAGILAERDRAVDEARAIAADLKTKGIHMDVDRMMRPTLLDRMQEKWDDLQDWWHARSDPEDPPQPDSAIFAVSLALAMTRPTSAIAADYDAIDAEVDRMVDALSHQITVLRGQEPAHVHIPDALIDDLAEQDDWTEHDEVIMSAGSIRTYWPPIGGPALALMVDQEDGGMSITVTLVGHGALAHGRFLQILAQHGGRLS